MRPAPRALALSAALALLAAPLSQLVAPAGAVPEDSSATSDLAHAAAVNQMSSAHLQQILGEDPTAHLDTDDRLFYIEPPAATDAEPTAVDPATLAEPIAAAFQLHSRPSSTHTLFIDFDGTTVQNTAWNDNFGVATSHPAWSLDGNSSTFNAQELAAIQSIWARVSEDYRAFDVDVTTEDPGAAAIDRSSASDQTFGTRALVSPSTDAAAKICNSGCGGVAYVGVYDLTGSNHPYYQPAWIFPQLLGDDTKNIAEAVSHEVGHNFGLSHDGTSGQGYYEGHNQWAPIMGVGYSRPVVQWSRGEYAGANNTEDDLAIIAANGAPIVADDAGNTVAKAAAFTTAARVITTRGDKDVFRISRCAGQTSIVATPAATSPDLDIKLDLLSSTGAVLATANPASATVNSDVASGMGATVKRALAAGTYYVRVDGTGIGSASTGYTDYASIGRYTLKRTCS